MKTVFKNQGIEMVACEIKVSYTPKIKAADRPQLNSSEKIYNYLINTWQDGTLEYCETFKVVYLNNSLRALGVSVIGVGGSDFTPVDVKKIFATALKINACKIVLSHNHPSGKVQPSQADRLLTKKVFDAGKLLDIQVLDHIIIADYSYYSFADEGII